MNKTFMNKTLKAYLTEKDSEYSDMSDAMWFNMMQDSVSDYNRINDSFHDEYDSIMEYVKDEFDLIKPTTSDLQ